MHHASQKFKEGLPSRSWKKMGILFAPPLAST